MFRDWAKLFVLLAIFLPGAQAGDTTLFTDEFKNLDRWLVEQKAGGTVEAKEGVLFIHDKGGCTVWFREKLTAPVSISYDAVVSSSGRVSDLNCFWMASDPQHPTDLFLSQRTGEFADYDSLQLYYVGYGGNNNTTTRFRRYRGDGSKPLLPEHDLRKKAFLLQPNRVYHLELIAENGVAIFRRDGETIFTYTDPSPLQTGWFGFRTVDAEIEIRNFRVTAQPTISPSVTAR